MIGARIRALAAPACVVALLGGAAAAGAQNEIPTYSAHYEVEYKGRRVGESTQSLERTADGYRFESVTEARGIIPRLALPRPLVEESVFELHEGEPRPLEFRYEDGTRKGEDNVSIEFDWTGRTARITSAGGSTDLPLEEGVHDRVTLQMTLMRELDANGAPEPHALIDDASIKTYSYEIAGEETLPTAGGTYETIKVVQQREGSSRHMILWLAPELHHLPVKIEQRRGDEVLMAFLLQSVQGLSDGDEGKQDNR